MEVRRANTRLTEARNEGGGHLCKLVVGREGWREQLVKAGSLLYWAIEVATQIRKGEGLYEERPERPSRFPLPLLLQTYRHFLAPNNQRVTPAWHHPPVAR